MSHHNAFRDGRVHVCRELCSTCIFRPGNPMKLRAGRVRQMVDAAVEHDSTIICHQTLGTDTNAACRGFYDRHRTLPFLLAEAMDKLEFTDPSPKEHQCPDTRSM